MKRFSHPDSRLPSQNILILAIASTILTIITVFLIVILNGSNTWYYFLAIILTLISSLSTLISMNIIKFAKKIIPSFSFIRKWLPTFIFHLFQTIGLISAVLTILTFLGIGSAVFGYLSHALPLTISGSAVFTLSIVIFILLYKEEKTKVTIPSKDTILYPPPSKDEEVEILLKEIVYEYAPDGQTLWQRKRINMMSLRNGLSHYTDRYRWTGSGKCVVRSLTPGFTVANTRKEEIWDYFDIKFPHALRKGEEVDFTIEWEMHDADKQAAPYLSTTIDRETKRLLLRVILPPKLAPKRAYTYEFENFFDTLPVETNEIHWSPATQALSYEVTFPKKYHKYLIRWYYE